jgi:hypothetical protein
MSLSRFVLPFADVGSGIVPSSGAKLFFYKTNTSTPLNTFSDEGGITSNTNPVISDGNGVFPDIFLLGTYKAILKDKNDVQKWEADPVTGEQNNSFSYAVSQLANGDATKVALISTGLDVTAIDYLVYPSDGRIYISKGVTGTMANDFNPTTGVDTGLSQPVYIVDFMGFGSMYSYAVSQLAAGDSSKVALIYPGLSITAFDFFVYTIDGRIYAKNGATGAFSNPLVFNPTDSTDSGITGALLNVNQNISNVFEYVVSQYAAGDKTKVALISPGLSLTAFDYFIYPIDGRVYFKNGATGTFSNPLVFNPIAGTDSGVTGTLINLKKNISDIFTYTVSQLANGDATKVGYILGGVPVLAFDFLIYPIDGRVYEKNGATGTFSNPLVFNPTTGVDSGLSAALLILNKKNQLIHVVDEKVSGVSGGTSASGFQKRALNTVISNSLQGASVISNEISLLQGKYYVEASAPALKTAQHIATIKLGSNNSVLLIGSNEYSDSTAVYSQTSSRCCGIIELSSADTIYIDHYTASIQSNNGLGVGASSSGLVSRFSEIKIWRVFQ